MIIIVIGLATLQTFSAVCAHTIVSTTESKLSQGKKGGLAMEEACSGDN